MKYDLVIFDLDGTALNTLNDIVDAANHTLNAAGFPSRTTEEVRRSIGGGVANLIELSVPNDAPKALHEQVLSNFKAYYSKNINVRTAPFEGIKPLFNSLQTAGIHIAVNSNKDDVAVQELCKAHFGDIIEIAIGEREGIPNKPSPAGALAIMNTLGIEPSRTLYIGDGDSDIKTAKNAGIDCAWVSWGFRKREELGDLEVPHAFGTIQDLKDFIFG